LTAWAPRALAACAMKGSPDPILHGPRLEPAAPGRAVRVRRAVADVVRR
jgi:hypothetical protein